MVYVVLTKRHIYCSVVSMLCWFIIVEHQMLLLYSLAINFDKLFGVV